MEKRGPAGPRRVSASGSRPTPVSSPETVREAATPSPATPKAVVGIGASAGGLDSFMRLVGSLSADTGLAFVLVQHFDPDRETLLPDILRRTALVPVTIAEDGMRVLPDNAYVIPPGTLMTLTDGHLKVVRRERLRGVHTVIDSFFKSLAEVHGDGAIGVVLSGAGSDGALGVAAIKEVGGITIAQDRTSAQFPSMPERAVATGCIDFVLPPEEIAEQLTLIARHSPPLMGTGGQKDEADALKILLLLRQRTGVDFRQYRKATVHRRIMRRMLAHRTETHGEYLAHVQKHPQELDSLFSDLLIGVTRFFRDPEAFGFLQNQGFPALLADRSHEDPIRVWVAGCSGGEETYTVAILLLEFLGERALEAEIQIFATDLSESAIKRARAAIYSHEIEADVSPERLERFFVREDAGYRIKRSVRDLCVFATHNVAKDPPFSQMDLIVCRNVLIYFDPKLQSSVMSAFHYSLKQGGILMLGSAESASSDYFKAIDAHHRIFRPKGRISTPLQRFDTDLAAVSGPTQREGPALVRGHRGTPIVNLAQQDADRLALARFAPPSVLVNERLDIVQLRGDTTGLLRLAPGTASLNLFKVAHPDLLAAVRSAIDAVREGAPKAREERVFLREGERLRQLAIEVIPFQSGADGDAFFLVAFETSGPELPAPDDTRSRMSLEQSKRGKARPRRAPLIEEVAQLREQLEAARIHLQDVVEQYEATNEELRAASEEIQSSNEELQSTNEELETTKEEVQSTNEELTTVNEELRHRNQDLAATSADLANVFATTQIPILIVSSDLRIRRFTPVTDRVARIIPTDVGRPIGDIRLRVDYASLEEAITSAIASLTITDAEVRDDDGSWWALTVRPYLTVDRKVDGAVIVFTDIDASKRSRATAEEIAESRRVLLAAAESARAEAVEANKLKTSFMANISHDLRTPLNAITGYVDLLEMGIHGSLTPNQREDLNRIKHSSGHLVSLINDILSFVQVDSGRVEFQMSEVPVSRAIVRLEEMLAPQLRAKELSFASEPTNAVVFADEEKMQQILLNLGTNAMKFTDTGGISVSGGTDQAMVRIHIADTGRGIPASQLQRIFEPFVQVDRGLTSRAGGVGLGLSIARELARQMGGDIAVVSTLGKGSTFTVSLPRARPAS